MDPELDCLSIDATIWFMSAGGCTEKGPLLMQYSGEFLRLGKGRLAGGFVYAVRYERYAGMYAETQQLERRYGRKRGDRPVCSCQCASVMRLPVVVASCSARVGTETVSSEQYLFSVCITKPERKEWIRTRIGKEKHEQR